MRSVQQMQQHPETDPNAGTARPSGLRLNASNEVSNMSQPANPLFYGKPELLTPDRHKTMGLSSDNSFAFAAKAVSIPLNAVEVPVAHAYPVVFASVAPYMPLAVTGLRQNENLFVDASGAWREGVYIPAYARRYPFALARRPGGDQFTLCIDGDSPRLIEDGGQALFDGKEPSELTKNALQFCVAFEQEMEATRKLMEVIHATNILVPNQATVNLPSGASLALTDFLVIDEQKLAALSDAVFAKLRAANALPLIYGHLASRALWRDLLQRLRPAA
jgi:hypothetical protein